MTLTDSLCLFNESTKAYSTIEKRRTIDLEVEKSAYQNMNGYFWLHYITTQPGRFPAKELIVLDLQSLNCSPPYLLRLWINRLTERATKIRHVKKTGNAGVLYLKVKYSKIRSAHQTELHLQLRCNLLPKFPSQVNYNIECDGSGSVASRQVDTNSDVA